MDFWDFWTIYMALTHYLEAQKIIKDIIPIYPISQLKNLFQMRMHKYPVNGVRKFKNTFVIQFLREIIF